MAFLLGKPQYGQLSTDSRLMLTELAEASPETFSSMPRPKASGQLAINHDRRQAADAMLRGKAGNLLLLRLPEEMQGVVRKKFGWPEPC